jgi:lambda repressor-like predicted transcriptional regulator
MAGKRGRPKGSVKLTPERTDIIVQALEKGHSLTSAARLAGLHRDTLNRWMKRGRKGENRLFINFCVTVQQALTKPEQKPATATPEVGPHLMILQAEAEAMVG